MAVPSLNLLRPGCPGEIVDGEDMGCMICTEAFPNVNCRFIESHW